MELCTKCGIEPRTESHQYCYACLRISRGQSPEPKFKRDSTNMTMCSKCKVKPRYKSHHYCRECKNAATVKWIRENGGSWGCKNQKQKQISVVRSYAHNLLRAGKVQRGPCMFCGAPGTQFHHFDYKPRTRNFGSVCDQCHSDAHKLLNSMKAVMVMGGRFPVDNQIAQA